LKKRSKKLLLIWTALVKQTVAQMSKSFLVTFFQKSNRFAFARRDLWKKAWMAVSSTAMTK
jgi:hypothetical protein